MEPAALLAMAVKACAFRFPAGAGIAPGNPDFLCLAFAVLVKPAVGGMALHIRILAGMAYGIGHAAAPFLKALTAGLIGPGGILAANLNIIPGTELVFVVHAILC